jgi:hypothetical protein
MVWTLNCQILVYCSMFFPRCIKYNFFVVGVACSTPWNMLWCPNPEVHICMRHSFISINTFKLMYPSGMGLLDLKQHLIFADICMISQKNTPSKHDCYRCSEWSGTLFSLILGVHNMNYLKPAAVGLYMPYQYNCIRPAALLFHFVYNLAFKND